MTTPNNQSNFADVFGEMQRGIDPRVLADMGYDVPSEYLPGESAAEVIELTQVSSDRTVPVHSGVDREIPAVDMSDTVSDEPPVYDPDTKASSMRRHPSMSGVGESTKDAEGIDGMSGMLVQPGTLAYAAIRAKLANSRPKSGGNQPNSESPGSQNGLTIAYLSSRERVSRSKSPRRNR